MGGGGENGEEDGVGVGGEGVIVLRLNINVYNNKSLLASPIKLNQQEPLLGLQRLACPV